MKSRLRLIVLLAVVASFVFGAAFAPISHVSAQSDQCFGLNADDCALANGAMQADATAKLSAFTLNYEITFNSTDPDGKTTDFSVKGTGPVSVDPAAMASLSKGDMSSAKGLTMGSTLSYTANSDGKSQSGNLEVRIVDGKLYYMGDQASKGKWMVVDLQKAASSGSTGMPMAGANPAQAMAALDSLKGLAAVPGFIKAERGPDATVEGQQVASFVYHFDVATLLSSPQLSTILKSMSSSNPSMSGMNDQQMQAILGMFGNMLKNSTFTVTRQVGTTDKLAHGLGIDVVLNIAPQDMAMLQAFGGSSAGGATPSASTNPLKANFHFLVTLSGIGTKVDVTAPEGAIPVDSANMMPTAAQ